MRDSTCKVCYNINIIMENDVFRTTKEYKDTVDKVNNSIRVLKTELISLRKNDLRLLRQLIHINDVIQSCYQRFVPPHRLENLTNCSKVPSYTKPPLPLVRQQSVPSYCATMRRETRDSSVCSSFEGIDELPEDISVASDDNDSIFSGSGCSPYDQRQIMRPRSLSYDITGSARDSADDIQLENVLLRNVELWKRSNKNKADITHLPTKCSGSLVDT